MAPMFLMLTWLDFATGVLGPVWQALWALLKRFAPAVVGAFVLISDWGINLVKTAFVVVWDAMPVMVVENIDQFKPLAAACNYWFPVAETLVLLTALVTFQVAFITVKLIIKMIPTIG